MTNVFIIHGAFGHPQENWFPRLKKELEKIGCRVFVPKFPTPEGQSLENWLNIFKDYEKYVDENTIFVAHSIGPAFVLHMLEKYKVKAAFLVGGAIANSSEVDDINKSFFEKPFNWKKIKENCKNIFVIGSDNDPYIPLEKTYELAEKLGVKPIIIPDAGHFNEKAGYTKFPFLLEKIKEFLK